MQYFNDKLGISYGIISGNVTSLFDVIKMDTVTEQNIEFYKDSVKFLKDSNGVFAACVETNILADFIPQFKGGDIVSVPYTETRDVVDYSKDYWYSPQKTMVTTHYKFRVNTVNIERMQASLNTEADYLANGITREFCRVEYDNNEHLDCIKYAYPNSETLYFTPKEAFAAFVDKYHGKGTYEKNPYIFRYNIKLIQQ